MQRAVYWINGLRHELTNVDVIDRANRIVAETEKDVAFLGQPGLAFNGQNVATMLGNIFAGVDALARLCIGQQVLIDQLEEQVRNVSGQLSDLRGE